MASMTLACKRDMIQRAPLSAWGDPIFVLCANFYIFSFSAKFLIFHLLSWLVIILGGKRISRSVYYNDPTQFSYHAQEDSIGVCFGLGSPTLLDTDTGVENFDVSLMLAAVINQKRPVDQCIVYVFLVINEKKKNKTSQTFQPGSSSSLKVWKISGLAEVSPTSRRPCVLHCHLSYSSDLHKRRTLWIYI